MPKMPARRWQGIAVEMFADAKARGLQGRAALRRERRIGNRKRQHDRNDMDGGGDAAEERYHGVCLFVSHKAIRQWQNRLVSTSVGTASDGGSHASFPFSFGDRLFCRRRSD